MKVQRLLLSVIALVAMTATAWADISKWIPEVIDGEPTEKVEDVPDPTTPPPPKPAVVAKASNTRKVEWA